MGWLSFLPKLKRSANADNCQDNFLLITWDSCRYDAFLKARTPVLDQYAPVQRGWTMATYTLPAHVSMFQGFLPHVAAPMPFYNRFCRQLWRINDRRLETTPLVTFSSKTRNVVRGFRERGYYTVGAGAMGFFRDAAVLRDGFHRIEYTGVGARRQNRIVIDALKKNGRRKRWFMFINYGETHSPFRHEDMPAEQTGVDERFNRRRLFNQTGFQTEGWTFDEESFDRQVECAEFLDARTGEVLSFLEEHGEPTTVIVCADHGECLGENGLIGHALHHEKVMEVPIMIFRLNAPQHSEAVAA